MKKYKTNYKIPGVVSLVAAGAWYVAGDSKAHTALLAGNLLIAIYCIAKDLMQDAGDA